MAEEKKEFQLPDKDDVEACIEKIRPYIQQDGGDIALLGIDENAVVYVAFRGACAGCMMAAADFSGGIKALILDEVPGVKDVMLVQ
ncbi:NifU family protein [Catenisphaera adipataccumulans]|jgi:Fe-S cluster biogenesis protein NfuA|uniref:Fe-S cluster biogenesis protein NfuA n=1 Tax=Catenisphaera adipataccumulans TaxID=700500 RepID=A0A7W8D051_9FIRM|nr:NifU family protein [Catenisphaera adipataccumulans]MBB5183663.1 Fe-S cluster biogenesis protein NfuA [Catenisphaera adipataccumulans]